MGRRRRKPSCSPGKECFECRFPDCIFGDQPTTEEEHEMLWDVPILDEQCARMQYDAIKFRNRAYAALNARGYTWATLSRISGIPKSTIANYVGGRSRPSEERLKAIARVLGVSAEWLLGR